ncbi:MAG: hypothetical protein IH991_08580 [Planctomycetes bacterium]|nr:hypothetical protein [Planctomycetota bacterium]
MTHTNVNHLNNRIPISRVVIPALLIFTMCGCLSRGPSLGELELVWGRRGLSNGRFQKPRAMAIDNADQIYIVDMTGRIQAFATDGQFLRSWRTPNIKNGKPCGLSFDRDDNLMVADTHYYRVLFYTRDGELLKDKTIGGTQGHGPGEFGFVTDAVQDSKGNYYIAEYGDNDRIQMFSKQHQFQLQWGIHGTEPGQFIRPQGLAVDDQDRIWVADACNHRIQVFVIDDGKAKLVKIWGDQGRKPGQLRYPYDLVLDDDCNVYIAEFGNNRIQKFTEDGKSLGCWGTPGRKEGELHQPWALVRDSNNRIHILDTYNHRVQRIVGL